MLSDTPRKLLLVINHYSRHFGRLPSMHELERLSGRTQTDIRNGLKVLTEENYIEWKPEVPIEKASIIMGWERDNPSHKEPQVSTSEAENGNTDYWMYY